MTLPLVSIVVPSFNQGRFLEQSLASIFRQNYPRLEVIVMDGGSTDESVRIIESYAARLTYWQSEPDGGQAAAINAGMQRCRGDLVAWLNSDDWYCDGALWTVARAYSRHPGHGLYVGNGFRYNQVTHRFDPFCPRHVALNREALIEGVDYILQPSTFVLRAAWNESGGLDTALEYSFDWDLWIRIAQRHPAVLINELLAVSREYPDTKTSRGSLARVDEIARIARSHGGIDVSEGSLYYRITTLLPLVDDGTEPGARDRLRAAFVTLGDGLARRWGNRDGFPERSDVQDVSYMPFVTRDDASTRAPRIDHPLPAISIVTPSMNQAAFLGQTLDSVLLQNYPHIELMVFDGGSRDGSIEILQQYAPRLAHWESEPDRGPAHAINKGFRRAGGEILSWLNSDDMLATDALWEVAAAFASDPDLDLVYGNALYIDEHNALHPADHGFQRTALYRGEMQPQERVAAYWSYVHAVPQPTVFFRRRLLERCGMLDESYQFIFDFELFWRFSQQAKVRKIERTLAFYRLHSQAKSSDWNRFLVELYRCSRPSWPSVHTPEFVATLRSFLYRYMQTRYGDRPHDAWFWSVAALAGLSAVTRIGNPEAWHLPLPPARPSVLARVAPSPPQLAAALHDIDPAAKPIATTPRVQRYRSVFHSYVWPRTPGLFGGEIRDFHLLRRLLDVGEVEFCAATPLANDQRADPLTARVTARHLPDALVAVSEPGDQRRYHRDVNDKLPLVRGAVRTALKTALARVPDFFFVSPQTNPVAMTRLSVPAPTRSILASYDVEAVRMQRLAASESGWTRVRAELEARRAVRFERDNLRCFDGVIAVSDLDKDRFVSDYGLSSERVLVIENGVDVSYFAFGERPIDAPMTIVFVATFSYPPNDAAAWRLIEHIMPRVRRELPAARLCLVGHGAAPALHQRADGTRIVVTGRVDDVRPWLAQATVACIPLRSGSGTKYKVLEAMSAGVPVVCSSIAREGLDIDQEHCRLADSDDDIARAVIHLSKQPAEGQAMARRARTQIERRYAWQTTLAPLPNWLAAIAAYPRRRI